MPLNIKLQIYFADENHDVLDSIFVTNQTDFVKASTVTANGELSVAGVSDQSFGMAPERLNNLFGSKYLIIKALMNTARDESGALLNVKFKSSYRLKLHFGLLAKLKINIK